MTTIKEYSGVVALVILAIMGLMGFIKGNSFGSASACTDGYTCYTNLEIQGNQITDGTATFNGAITTTGTTTVSGNIVVSTSNTATSSISAGCYGFNATSTATPGHLALTISNTSTSSTDGAGAYAFVVYKFGKCPGT